MYPFTIQLKDRVGGELQQVQIKIDPGSKHTGVSVVRNEKVLNLFQINHRGRFISANLTSRRQMRRRRRSNLRYRKARFNNRTKKEGSLAFSLQHRVDTVISFVSKL